MINLENRTRFVELFGYLIWIRIAAVALSLLSMLPVVGGYAEMIINLPNLALVVVLWMLGNGAGRYRKSAVLLAVSLGIGLAVSLLSYWNVTGEMGWLLNDAAAYITLASSVCSFLAVYQEYNAHAEAIAPIDKDVSRKWERLFGWQIAYLLVSYVLSFVLIAVFFAVPVILEAYAWAVELVNLAIAWCYIQNLKAMCCSIQNME